MSANAPGPARLEAFSDGVIAVIITVMVLEIKVPRADGFEGLRQLVPGLLIYLLSFSFTGIYWLNHQHLTRRVETAGNVMQCANLGFLFCLSLLPLSTAYAVDKGLSGFAVAVYATLLLIVGLAFLCFRLAVHGHLSRRAALLEEDRRGLRNHLLSLAVYSACIVGAPRFPRAALLVIASLTFLWTLPNLSMRPARTLK
jgi:uncharacterized membrane protein